MCNFISWVECEKKIHVITDAEVKSERGKELLKESGSPRDIFGHGFCRRYYGLTDNQGKNCENENPWDESLPEEIKKIVGLDLNKNFGAMFGITKTLDLSSLQSLPDGVKFPEGLKTLYLRSLQSLPDGVKLPEGLESLDLYSLQSLPDGVSFPEGLEYLDLSSLQNLPAEVKFPEGLKTLDLSFLRKLPARVKLPKCTFAPKLAERE